MICEKLDVQTALEQGAQLPYSYIRQLSRVYLGKTSGPVELDGLLEARFFSDQREVRVFRQNGSWKGAVLAEEAGDRKLTEQYELANSAFGRRLTVVHQLTADEDGQTCVAATRLAGWEGDERNG